MSRRGKSLDFWIVVINEEGIHAPLHVFGELQSTYLCDKSAAVNRQNKVVVNPLDTVVAIDKSDVTFKDISLDNLPALSDVIRHWYAATMDNARYLSIALSRLRKGEDVLEQKVRQQHAANLAAQRVLLIEDAKKILFPE